jgi:hypothetical protein
MDARLSSRSLGSARVLLACALVAMLMLFTACSSSSKSSKPPTKAAAQTSLVRWRQCLARHGVRFPVAKPAAPKKPIFTRRQLLIALQKNPKLRAEFGKALLKAPPGIAAARYKAAVTACLPALPKPAPK